MLNITPRAKEKINELLKNQDSSSTGLRVFLHNDKPPEISFKDLTKLAPDEDPLRDRRTHFFVEIDGFLIIVDSKGQTELSEAILDLDEGGSFQVKKPEIRLYEGPDTSNPLVGKVQELLETEINPGLAMHGGRAELLNVIEDKVYLKFGGGCQGCSMIDATVKQGIEARIREVFPQISGVVDETDHAAGTNPYFQG